MKTVVTVKQVPAPGIRPRLAPDNTIARDQDLMMDPGDECGVEVGLRLKEAHGGEVVLLSMGPVQAGEVLRRGLAMGADRGILVSDQRLAGSDALLTARVLAAASAAERPDLVICATESFDGATGVVPQMMAELLGLPQLTFATLIQVDGREVTIHRQTNDGHQVLRTYLPCLVTVTSGIAEPRYASLKDITSSRSKQIEALSLADLSVVPTERTEVIDFIENAAPRVSGDVVDYEGEATLERILSLLRQAKVL